MTFLQGFWFGVVLQIQWHSVNMIFLGGILFKATNITERGCGIKGIIPTSVMQGNPRFYDQITVVSQKWSFPTALHRLSVFPPLGF